MTGQRPALRVALFGVGALLAGFAVIAVDLAAVGSPVAPIALAGLVTAVLIAGWVRRGVLFWRSARRSGRPMVARVLSGEVPDSLPLGTTVWLALAEPQRPGARTRWQRIAWHPALDATPSPTAVLVHGDPSSRRRVTVELPGGVRLVPIGPLRQRRPARVFLRARADVRVRLDDSFILPTGTPPMRGRPWWFWGVRLAGLGAVAGAGVALVTGSPAGIVPLAAAGAALLANGWAMRGVEP
ncbi:MAG: hypothetical protein HYR62_07350 [Actinobacteria bacterium]|nr:hypothetical protein [Actinomycetota bacterium]MBI3685992.1 hypothetical protein [Actinomycetota bacterium]